MAKQAPTERRAKVLAELLPRENRNHPITLIREPDPEERERIERADSLIQTAAANRAYERVRDVQAVLERRVGEMSQAASPGPGEIEALRAGFVSLLEGLERFMAGGAELIETYGTGEAAHQFQEQAETVRASQLWRDLAGLGDARRGRFFRDAQDRLVWQDQSADRTLPVGGLARLAGLQAQELLIGQFLALDDELHDAAALLRQLTVEAPEGVPGLVELTMRGDKPDLANFTPHALAIDSVSVALRAVRIARQVQEHRESAVESGQGAPESGSSEARSETSADPERELRAEDSGEEKPEVPDSEAGMEPAPVAVELSALFRLARTLDGDLQHAWSAALDETLLQPALEKQVAAVMSLLYALQRKVAAEDASAKAIGTPTIKEWPLSVETVAELEVAPGERTRVEQLRLAQLDAVSGVTEVIDGLRQPANITISIGEDSAESVERFWAAGAFGLIRDRLALLERLTRQLDQAQEDSGGTEPRADQTPTLSRDAFDRLQLGGQAWSGGDPEAALLHAVAAASLALDAPSAELAERVAEQAKERPGLDEFSGPTFGKAVELAEATLHGRPNLAAAVFLAPAALRILHLLTLGPLPARDISFSELADRIEADRPLEPLEPESDEPEHD